MKKFVKATLIITVFSVATRALGFVLRIVLSRLMGAETLGAYQISMSIFGVLMTIIASGLPLIVSRNVSYYQDKDVKKQNRIISAGTTIGLSISLLIVVLFFACKDFILLAVNEESVNMILILLPCLIVSSIYAILRGGLWGKKKFFTISFTEFFEQVVRIIILIVLVLLPIDLSMGNKSALSLTLSAVASCLLVFILYFCYGEKFANPKGEIKPILKSSAPITLVRTISSVIGSIIAIILPSRLMLFGYSRAEALAVFGVYMGMTLPLIMVPSTFISSIAIALVPELSKETNNIALASEKTKLILQNKIMMAIKSVFAISFVLMPAFISVGIPICKVLFNNAQAGQYLVMSAALMKPMGINQICSSILNAIGLEKRELLNYSVGAILLVICVVVLPQYVGGISILIGLGVMHIMSAILSLVELKRRNLINWSFNKYFAICGLILAPTALLGHLIYSLLARVINLFVSTIISGGLTFIFTILLMYVFNVANLKIVVYKHRQNKNKLHEKTTV